jgi:hypothetical protein
MTTIEHNKEEKVVLHNSDTLIESICEKVDPKYKGVVLAELKTLVKAVTMETARNWKNGSDMLFEKITKNL